MAIIFFLQVSHLLLSCNIHISFPLIALICITCTEEPDVAFANYRLMQSFGLMVAFGSGTFMCVAGKLYLLMIMLVVSIMFYVLAEYKVRQVDDDQNEDYIT